MSTYKICYDRDGNIVLRLQEEVSKEPVREESPEIPLAPSFSRAKLSTSPHFIKAAHRKMRKFERGLSPRSRMAAESIRFIGTFTAVFLFLFVSLNFGSYFQVIQARLLPERNVKERTALLAMTNPLLREKLLSVPALPAAGRNHDALPNVLSVAPPDNRLIVPAIGKNVPFVEVSADALKREDWSTFEKDIQHALRFGVVHYPGTAVPGQMGNVFFTGHSSYYPLFPGNYKDVFALLGNLEIGDEYSIYYEGELHRYRIADKFEVSPRDVSVLDQPVNRRMSTLMTCTPIGTTLRRLILQADEIDLLTGEILELPGEKSTIPSVQWGGELAV